MKIKTRLYLIYLLLVLSIFIFLFIIYSNNIQFHNDSLDNYLEKEIEIQKKTISSNLHYINNEYIKRQSDFLQIHKEAQEIIINNTNKTIEEVKNQLANKYSFLKYKIDLYLINKNYRIFDSTYKKDIGLDLSRFIGSKKILDNTNILKKVSLSDYISEDKLENKYKYYTYSKISNNTYLELGFTDKGFIGSFDRIDKNVKVYRIKTKSNRKEQYYYDMATKSNFKTKQEFFDNIKAVQIDKVNDDMIINTNRKKKKTTVINDNIVTIYVPLLSFKELKMLKFTDVVLEIKLDIKSQLEALEDTKTLFIYITIILILFLLIIFIYIHNNITKPSSTIINSMNRKTKINEKKLINSKNEFGIITNEYNRLFDSFNKEIEKNQLLLDQNKQFIADMVHQVRTPLSVIMTNTSLIELKTNEKLSIFLEQINSSISMLSNSYEDLSYIISHDTLEYQQKEINLSTFLEERVKFFNVIVNANFKSIKYNIEPDVFVLINDIELERLIDNNISNAIKHSNLKSLITIKMYIENKNPIISFESEGKNIKNIERIFDKNYRENDSKRSLGLGLNMVKTICEKNNISYHVESREGRNIFYFKFQNKTK